MLKILLKNNYIQPKVIRIKIYQVYLFMAII